MKTKWNMLRLLFCGFLTIVAWKSLCGVPSSTVSTAATQSKLTSVMGDANLDSVLSLADIHTSVGHISGYLILSESAFQNANINGDEVLDLRDVVGIVNLLNDQTIYYLSQSEGDNDADGRSPMSAWKDLSRLEGVELHPGDQVLLKAGDTWRETFYVHGRGAIDSWIHFGSYGTGPRPRILGSERATPWVEIAPDVWECQVDLANPYQGGYSYGEVFFETLDGRVQWGKHVDFDSGFSQLQNEFDWTWNDSRLFIRSTEDPDIRYQAVEAPQRDSCVRFPDINGSTVLESDYVQYLSFDRLELMFARRHGIYPGYNEVEAHGLRITDCRIGCIGVKGGASAYGIAAWHSDMLIKGNTIHDCGRRGVSLNTYTNYTPGLTLSNIRIDGNHFFNGFHTTGPDVSSMSGRGHTMHDVTICNNLIDDRGIVELEGTSNAIYINATSGNSYHHFYLYNNVILGASARAILLFNLDRPLIAHNSVFGNHPNANPYALITFVDVTNIDFRNNIVHSTLMNPPSMSRCVLDEENTSFSYRNYNLYFQSNPDQPFTGSENGFGGWNVFMWQWQTWTQGSGFDLNSPEPQDPRFVDANAGNLELQPGSPAANAGTPCPEVLIDFLGRPRDLQNPCIGALELVLPPKR